MKLTKITLLFSIITVCFVTTQAQTTDEIISKYIDANGGKEKLSHLETIYSEADVTIMGNTAPSVIYLLNGKGSRSEVDFNGQKVITCYTDKGGWTINPMLGQTTAVALPEEQVKTGQLQLDLPGPLFDYAAKGNKVVFLGKENVNGAAAYRLQVTTPSNVEIGVLIDTATYYAVKTVTKINFNGQDAEMSIVNSDFKTTDYGSVMPFAQEITLPGITITSTTKKIEINKNIDQAIFEMPKD